MDHAAPAGSPGRLAVRATVHCLTGCAIGETLGMVLGTALAWSDLRTIVASVLLAFFFGYALTLWPLRRAGLSWRRAVGLALASDTISIAVMEIVDNALMLVIPGAMDAPLDSSRFWLSLAVSLVVAGLAAFPINRWLILRGRGHAVVHDYHEGHGGHGPASGGPAAEPKERPAHRHHGEHEAPGAAKR